MSHAIFEKVSIQIAGEDALIIYFAEQASAEVSEKIQQAEQIIRQHMAGDIIDLIPSYASIMVMFNIFEHDHHYIRDKLRVLLKDILSKAQDMSTSSAKLIELPVFYHPEVGPELSLIAKQSHLTIREVIEIHQAQEYLVYAIGFAPGFAYLGEVDERIASPRLNTPRLKVPKGAVAIADRQTAIYPSESPGGWNIIGVCPIDMFNPDNTPCMPVQVGDKVKFKEITQDEFVALGGVFPEKGSNIL